LALETAREMREQRRWAARERELRESNGAGRLERESQQSCASDDDAVRLLGDARLGDQGVPAPAAMTSSVALTLPSIPRSTNP